VSRRKRKRILPVGAFLSDSPPKYDVSAFPEDLLYRDKVVSVLGPPIDGWIPELAFRYAVFQPIGLNVDWAIMLNARRTEDGTYAPRRRVERIDICHSEVHFHRFRRSGDPDDDQGERKAIISLYAGDEATVNDQFDLQMMRLSHDWELRMRRWIDG
jgi:hypothetical protein